MPAFLLSFFRQCHGESGPFPDFAGNLDRSVMQVHDPFCQRQPQTVAGSGAGGICLIEPLVYSFLCLLIHADAIVCDGNDDIVLFFAQKNLYLSLL